MAQASFRVPRSRNPSETHATLIDLPSFSTTMNMTSINATSFMSVNESVASWMNKTAITKLRNWCISPKSRDSYRVRVIGMDDQYSLDDSHQSRITSGVVGTRRNNRLVETKSGSVYQLVGPCHVRKMAKEGYSANLINAFKHGFPEKWIMFLQDDQRRREAISSLTKKGIYVGGNGKQPSMESAVGE